MEGSWYFGNADAGGAAGGRLYVTAMACLCLEESFRHLPMMRDRAEGDAPEGEAAGGCCA